MCQSPVLYFYKMMRISGLLIASTPGKGRAVFTELPIAADTIIEIAPVIVMRSEERRLLDQTLLHDYIFEWGEDKTQCAMALGWIPIYNHALPSNAEYFMNFEEATIFIKAARDIAAGEEITINYNGDFNDSKPVWFELHE